jgi:hypothetical protein
MLSDLGKRMLVITARRGYTGADREIFFHFIRGIRYSEMEKEVQALEREGLISIEWVGPSNFTVSITAEGVEVAKAIEEGVWHKSLEALEQMHKEKHPQRSILEERGEHSYRMKDKTKVQEVGNLPSDIMQTLDRQIMEERQAAYEEENGQGVGVPATGIMEEEGAVQGEEDIVERRIEGEIDYTDSGEGEEVYLKVGEGSYEDRIEQNDKSLIKKRVREKRIEGELDTPDFDDNDSIPIEENMDGIGIIDDKISEYDYSGPPSEGEYEQIEEEVPEYIEEEIEQEVQEDIPDDPVYEREVVQMAQQNDREDEEISDTDLYKQIVDTISMEDSPSGSGDSDISVSNLMCNWEDDFPCPLKINSEDPKEITITPQHCMVCQLVQIKKILKEKQD